MINQTSDVTKPWALLSCTVYDINSESHHRIFQIIVSVLHFYIQVLLFLAKIRFLRCYHGKKKTLKDTDSFKHTTCRSVALIYLMHYGISRQKTEVMVNLIVYFQSTSHYESHNLKCLNPDQWKSCNEELERIYNRWEAMIL